jgi:hypothetical protein
VNIYAFFKKYPQNNICNAITGVAKLIAIFTLDAVIETT